jgi:hypothetical protein
MIFYLAKILKLLVKNVKSFGLNLLIFLNVYWAIGQKYYKFYIYLKKYF